MFRRNSGTRATFPTPNPSTGVIADYINAWVPAITAGMMLGENMRSEPIEYILAKPIRKYREYVTSTHPQWSRSILGASDARTIAAIDNLVEEYNAQLPNQPTQEARRAYFDRVAMLVYGVEEAVQPTERTLAERLKKGPFQNSCYRLAG